MKSPSDGAIRWLWLLVLAPCLAFGSALRLECDVEGQRLPFAGCGKDCLLVRQGEKILSVPEYTTWHLVGDLKENMGFVRWAPRQKMNVEALSEFNGFQEITTADITAEFNYEEYGDKLTLIDWPKAKTADAALVTLWLINGEAKKVIVRAVRPAGEKGYVTGCTLLLSPDETSGQPAMLFWSKGEFLAPVPEYKDAATQQAFVATLANDVEGLKKAVDAGAKLKKKTRGGASLTHYAAVANAPDTLEYLIQRNPEAAKADDKFQSDDPMRWATLTGRLAAIRTLLKAGVSPNPQEKSDSPLGPAVFTGHTEVVRLLMQVGASPHSKIGSNPLSDAIVSGYTEMAEILMNAGGKHDFKTLGTQWNLVQNAGRGHESMVKLLLDHGVDPNATEFVQKPRTETIWVQTQNGRVEVPPEDLPAITPLSGVTALMRAAESGSYRSAAALLAHGAKPNLQTSEGATALHFAAEKNSASVVTLLLEHHADFSLKNKAGMTPLDVALFEGATEVVDTLIQAGAKIDLHGPNAQKSLASALREDISGVIAAALADGWNANSKFDDDFKALALARLFGAKTSESLLIKAGAEEVATDALNLVKLTELDAPPKPVKTEMPDNLRVLTKPETVRAAFILNRDGMPKHIHVLDSQDRHLTAATLRSVENWRFSPPTKSGKPVLVRLVLPIVYPATKERHSDEKSLNTPVILHTARPVYPLELSPEKTPGRVWVNLLIKADGTISDVKVESSTDPRFERCALQALKDYRFAPKVIGGVATDSRLRFAIEVIPPK